MAGRQLRRSAGFRGVRISPSGNAAGDWFTLDYNSDGTLAHRADLGGATTCGYDAFGLLQSVIYPGGLGMGDVKLALLIGAALGWAVTAALLLGTIAAGVVAAIMLFKEGSSARKRAIPLGPFLAAGAIVVLLFL